MNQRILNILNFIAAGLGNSFLIVLPFMAVDLGFNLSQSGLIKSLFHIVSIISIFFVIKAADKFSNKKMLFFSAAGIAVFFFSFGLINNFISLIFTRIIWAVLMTTLSVLAKNELSRFAVKGNKGKIIGNFQATGELGKLVLATLVGYLIIWYGWRFSAISYGVVTLLLIIITIFIARKIPYRDVDVKRPKLKFSVIKENKRIINTYLCIIWDYFCSSSIPLFLPFLIIYNNYSAEALPNLTFIMLIGAIAGRFFMGRIAEKHSTGKILFIGEMIMGIMAMILALSSNFYLFSFAVLIIGIFTKGTTPVTQMMMIESAENQQNLKNEFAIENTIANLGAFVSALVFGLIGDHLGLSAVFLGIAISAFVAAVSGLFYYLKFNRADHLQNTNLTIQ